ncbi:hypothetical protein MLD38_038919 [Melastoma candidum]|uniref:Uncharacterized protein n=1 Tax=Melastoma candidum TaxID=119954 RepID=A0ACB9L1Q9_9MYRT|nr:hypothetical protein MLD38_038919 [Melastoma candidum]
MTRKCSHCSHNGHNSRTCPNKGVKLFGVRLTDGSIRKSASMGSLSHYSVSGSGLSAGSGGGGSGGNYPGSPGDVTPEHAADGYASEDGVPGSSSRERKKGVPWTEEEHRMFLLGLQKLGKGDWRGISRNYVVTRTPTQVASHAQKYFIRQSNVSRRKRRSSLFDIVAEETGDTPMISRDFFSVDEQQLEKQTVDPSPAPIPPEVAVDEECESMESTNSNNGDLAPFQPENLDPQPCYPVMYPAYFSPFCPFPLPALWTGYSAEAPSKEKHEVLKPTAVHTKSPINVDELVGMSKLSLGEAMGEPGTSSLSLKLAEGSRRQSAFHANPMIGTSSLSSSSSNAEAVQRC